MAQNRLLLAFEFFLLCLLLPSIIIVFRLAPFMFAFLWGAAGYCFLVMRLRYHEELKTLWKWRAVTWPHLKPILIRWAVCCVFMMVFICFYDPDRLFALAKQRPLFIPILFALYPVLSALPQEFIFCSFFFKRYETFFKSPRTRIIASSIVFAYAHMLFINPVAPLLSLVAGLIFADTYNRHKSLALVTIEHGLYGNFLFVIGLGWYFYGGAVAQMNLQ